MNIACTACSARYGVADEKLIGKRVRITCKRCGTVLIVDGNTNPPTVTASTSMAPSPPASARPAAEARAPAPEPPFMVAFADGRQEQADIAQIVRFHRAGQLGADSLVWREGMGDWSDPWDVAEISAAFRRMGYSRPTPPPAPPPAAPALRDAADDEATQVVESSPQHEAPLFDDNEATHVVDSSRLASPEPLQDPRAASRPFAEEDDSPTHVGRAEHVAPARGNAAAREAQRGRRVSSRPPRETAKTEPQRAARQVEPQRARTERRSRSARPVAGPGVEDMFARQRMAGSEEEQADAPQNLGPGYELDIPKLTGARNESSVLFSLDTLLKQEQKSVRPARPPRRDESLLVDSGASLPFGGGGIAPALAAPDFTAPISSPPPQFAAARVADEEKVRSSRAWLYIVVLVAFGGAGAFGWKTGALRPLLVKAGVMPPPPAAASADSAAPRPSATPPQGDRVAAPNSAEPEASAVASASAGTAPRGSAAAERPAAAAAATPRAPATGTAAGAATSRATTAATTAATGTHEATTKEKEASHETAAASTTASPAGGAAFDTGAAKEVLTAAAGNVASCKEMGGPVGSGKVSITFAPSGRPTSVAVSGALTTVGSCVARLFRSVKVPPFAGDPVTVAKGFSLE